MMKKVVKKVIIGFPFLYKTYLNFVLHKNGTKFEKKIRKVNASPLSKKDFMDILCSGKGESQVCHIIGGGRSLNDSIRKITSKDFVIGFNYAALADIKFDVYFFEFGGFKVKRISDSHLKLCKEVVLKQTDLIFFKNVWEDKNDSNYINQNWVSIANFTKDRIWPLLDKKYAEYTVGRCFEDDSDYLPQLCSSVMTALFIAYKIGFKQIVIHGLDFGGLYFYEESCAADKVRYLPTSEVEFGSYSNSKPNSLHATTSGAVGMKDIIPIAYEYLRNRNVQLYCATSTSPSSSFLPAYKE